MQMTRQTVVSVLRERRRCKQPAAFLGWTSEKSDCLRDMHGSHSEPLPVTVKSCTSARAAACTAKKAKFAWFRANIRYTTPHRKESDKKRKTTLITRKSRPDVHVWFCVLTSPEKAVRDRLQTRNKDQTLCAHLHRLKTSHNRRRRCRPEAAARPHAMREFATRGGSTRLSCEMCLAR